MTHEGWGARRDPYALGDGGYWRRPTVPQAWSPHVSVSVGGGSGRVRLVVSADGLLGWSAEELAIIPFTELLHPDDRQVLGAVHGDELLPAFVPVSVRVLSRDSRYWRIGGYVVRRPGQDGAVARINLVEPVGAMGCPTGMWHWDPQQDIVTWSPELLWMFAMRVGPPSSYAAFLDMIVDEDRIDLAGQIQRAGDRAHEFSARFRCKGDDGHELWFHTAGRATTSPSGQMVAGIVKYLNPPQSWWNARTIGCG